MRGKKTINVISFSKIYKWNLIPHEVVREGGIWKLIGFSRLSGLKDFVWREGGDELSSNGFWLHKY